LSTAPATWWTAWRWPCRLPLLVRHAPAFVSDAFCRSRLEQVGHHNYGTLPRGVDVAAIIARATPKMP
jgi:putative acyl-CoA dehydrogenase